MMMELAREREGFGLWSSTVAGDGRGAGIIFKGGRGMAGWPAEGILISGPGRMGWGYKLLFAGLAWPWRNPGKKPTSAPGEMMLLSGWMDGRCVCLCACVCRLGWMDGCLSDMAEFPAPARSAQLSCLSSPTSPPPESFHRISSIFPSWRQ